MGVVDLEVSILDALWVCIVVFWGVWLIINISLRAIWDIIKTYALALLILVRRTFE